MRTYFSFHLEDEIERSNNSQMKTIFEYLFLLLNAVCPGMGVGVH